MGKVKPDSNQNFEKFNISQSSNQKDGIPVLSDLISIIDPGITELSRDLIRRAWSFAEEKHKGQYRKSGDDYFIHCSGVAMILARMNMDAHSICAGLLHDVIEDTDTSFEELQSNFNLEIANLVDGVTKISGIATISQTEEKIENLRKMILAMAKDIRVIIIKLADRLHNMRTIQYLTIERQKKISLETREIFVPLANRLGMGKMKAELEDRCMEILEPAEYFGITSKTNHDKDSLDKLIENTIENIKADLVKYNIPFTIKGRTKNIYGIYRKMKMKNLNVDEVYDISGIRIITETNEQCYALLGYIHQLFSPVPGTFDDYIAVPKKNGYQSIHTTVVGPQGRLIEIQIRTWEMDRIADVGIAAHWMYKEGTKSPENLEDKIRWLRRVVEWVQEIKEPEKLMDALKVDLFEDSVLVFTPRGQVIELPKGSTPLDFAYAIHTEVGHSYSGAKVKGRIVQLSTELNNYDVVEVMRSKNAHPSHHWLSIVKTNRARSKIRNWIKNQNNDANIAIGRERFIKALKRKQLTMDVFSDIKKFKSLMQKFNTGNIDEMFAEIGFQNSTVRQLENKLDSIFAQRDKIRKRKETSKPKPRIIIQDMDDVPFRFARCCNPLPGDKIIGFITRGQGVSIHKIDCPNLDYHRKSKKENVSRMVGAKWRDFDDNQILRVHIVAKFKNDLFGIFNHIFVENHSTIYESGFKMKSDRVAEFRFSIGTNNSVQASNILSELGNLSSIIDINQE